jgi:uncharacterized membrane protein
MNASDFRKLADDKMSKVTSEMVVTYLILIAVNSALTGTGIGALLLSGPLLLGFVNVVADTSEGKDLKLARLFSGFDNFFKAALLFILNTLYIVLWSMLFVIPGLVKSYSYSMAYFILKDNPDIDPNEAITQSRKMMDGHKWRLFCLNFSYIGWIFLSAFTFGILMLWIAPKMQIAKYEFYLDLKKK